MGAIALFVDGDPGIAPMGRYRDAGGYVFNQSLQQPIVEDHSPLYVKMDSRHSPE
ncbi:MAG: hypothetical protein ACYC42_00690 [Lysobacter sp.]